MSNDHSVRLLEVLDGRAFSQKLRVAGYYVFVNVLWNTDFSDDFGQHLSSANWNSRFLNQNNLLLNRMLIVMLDDLPYCNFSVGEVISLTFILSKSFGGSR